MRRLFLLAALLGAVAAHAQDYERERRWAEEVVPGVVVGDAVRLRGPGGRDFLALYAAPPPGTRAGLPAVLLAHGRGVHPDHGVIGALRVALADAGYATLSLQMPVLRAEAGTQDYGPALEADAAERIRAGASWLAAKGAGRVVLLSHSLGSRMADAMFAHGKAPPLAGWICLGLLGGYTGADRVRAPVLDVYGEADFPEVLQAAGTRRAALSALAGASQLRIDGADHYFTGRERALAEALVAFLGRIK